MFVPPTFS